MVREMNNLIATVYQVREGSVNKMDGRKILLDGQSASGYSLRLCDKWRWKTITSEEME